jgi:hypothetical protein
MSGVRESEALKMKMHRRKTRQDYPSDSGISTWDLVRQALETGESDEALALIDEGLAENRIVHHNLVSAIGSYLNHIFSSIPEEDIEKVLRQRYYPIAKDTISSQTSVEETLRRFVRYQRANLSQVTVVEEPNRYVVAYNPCGSGEWLMRTMPALRLKKAYPWSWSRSGVPYYCLHCCIGWEIIPTELRGYPLYIHLPPERLEAPCIQLHYKKAELIPEEYFTRIGKTKAIK